MYDMHVTYITMSHINTLGKKIEEKRGGEIRKGIFMTISLELNKLILPCL